MKKVFFFIFICSIGYKGRTQEILLQVIDNYYPANPFADKFSTFLQDLMYNKFISDKTVHKRTDSTFFYFKGNYILQNPFNFQPSHIDVILAEQEFRLSDSSKVADTILIYQLIGYTDKGLKIVKNEFTQFEKQFGVRFYSSTVSDIMNAGQPEGASHNYFLKTTQVSPISVSWGRMNNNEYAYIVTIRFLAKQNEALLPTLATKN